MNVGPTPVAVAVPVSGGCVVANVGPTRGEGLHVEAIEAGRRDFGGDDEPDFDAWEP